MVETEKAEAKRSFPSRFFQLSDVKSLWVVGLEVVPVVMPSTKSFNKVFLGM